MFHVADLKPNYVRMRISPDVALAFGLNVLSPTSDVQGNAVEILGSRYPNALAMDAYERVLTDAIAGDPTHFARQDYVEEAWRIVDPVLKGGTPIHEYEPGTWGPKAADDAVMPHGGWQSPVITN
jgi:glucose-6-phosphate 1-dehydrogenase